MATKRPFQQNICWNTHDQPFLNCISFFLGIIAYAKNKMKSLFMFRNNRSVGMNEASEGWPLKKELQNLQCQKHTIHSPASNRFAPMFFYNNGKSPSGEDGHALPRSMWSAVMASKLEEIPDSFYLSIRLKTRLW